MSQSILCRNCVADIPTTASDTEVVCGACGAVTTLLAFIAPSDKPEPVKPKKSKPLPAEAPKAGYWKIGDIVMIKQDCSHRPGQTGMIVEYLHPTWQQIPRYGVRIGNSTSDMNETELCR